MFETLYENACTWRVCISDGLLGSTLSGISDTAGFRQRRERHRFCHGRPTAATTRSPKQRQGTQVRRRPRVGRLFLGRRNRYCGNYRRVDDCDGGDCGADTRRKDPDHENTRVSRLASLSVAVPFFSSSISYRGERSEIRPNSRLPVCSRTKKTPGLSPGISPGIGSSGFALGVTPGRNGLARPHAFVQKTIVRMETCIPCGKRITFGKIAYKCRDCRLVSVFMGWFGKTYGLDAENVGIGFVFQIYLSSGMS